MVGIVSPFSAHFQSNQPSVDTDTTKIEVKQAEINPFMSLIQSYSGLRFSLIDSANVIFGVHWKNYTFELTHQSELILMTKPAEELVTTECAELMLKLLFALTFNKKVPAQIQSPNRAHEQILWTICTNLHYPIKSQKADQRSRFDLFAADLQRNFTGTATLKQLERNQHLHIVETKTHDAAMPISFAGHFQKERQHVRQFTQLSLQTDQMNPVLNLLKELGEIQFTFDESVGNIIISLGDSKFSIEQKAEFFNLSLLNTTMLKPGVAEIVARILELLILDFSQDKTHGLRGGGVPVKVNSSHPGAVNAAWKQLDKNPRVKIQAAQGQESDLRRLRQEHVYTASRQFSSLLQKQKNQGGTSPSPGPSPFSGH